MLGAGRHEQLRRIEQTQDFFLAKLWMKIEELVGRQESAAFAGSALFMTEMRLTVPPKVAVRKLRTDLEALCNELNCDVDLEPAEA